MDGLHWSAWVAMLVSVAAFWLVQCRLRQKSKSASWISFAGLALFSVPSLLAAAYYLHVLPETEWFYTMRSWNGAEYLVIFVGVAGGAVAALLPKFLTIVPLFLSMVVAVIPYLKPVMNPLSSTEFNEQWQDDACLQSTASTCGPASVASIFRSFGMAVSEREIARAAFTSGSGTEAWYLARFVRSRGLDATFDFESGLSSSVKYPAMVGVRIGGYGHFIAVLGVVGGDVDFVDPLSGKHRVSMAGFLKRYEFTGFHMSVDRPSI